jgi:hypothetical protein
VETAVRQARQLETGNIVVMSAVNPASLGGLLEEAGAVLARNLNAALSRIA